MLAQYHCFHAESPVTRSSVAAGRAGDYAPSAVMARFMTERLVRIADEHHVARGFDLLAADALRGFAVAARERFDERLVLVLHLLRAFAQAQAEVQEPRHLVEQVLDRGGEPRVAGRLRDRHVESLVRFEKAAGALRVARLVARAADFVVASCSCCVFTLPAAMRAAAGSSMSRSSNTSWMSCSVTGHDHVAAARDRAHEAVVGELGQRDAHGRLAELVLAAELRFRDLAARARSRS